MKLNDFKTLGKAVEFYINQGFSVISVPLKSKTPNVEWKKYQNEKPTREEQAKWFSKPSNVAIVCGKISGNLMVIDIDDRALYEKIFPNHTELEKETLVTSTSRGVHIYLKTDDPTSAKYEKVDICGEGHLVMAPPSIHPTGVEYEVISTTSEIKEIQRSELETVLVGKLKTLGLLKERKPTHKIKEVEQDGEPMRLPMLPCYEYVLSHGCKEGERNEGGFRLATYLKNKGRLRKETTLSILSDWNKNNSPPLDVEDVNTILDSVWKRGYYSYGCEKLRQVSAFNDGCSKDCKVRQKLEKKAQESQLVEDMFELITKMVVLPGNTTYIDFYIQDEVIHLNSEEITSAKAFANAHMKQFYDFEVFFKLMKMSTEGWSQLLMMLNEEKSEIKKREAASSDDYIRECVKNFIGSLPATHSLEEAVTGSGAIHIHNKEAWIAIKVIKRHLDRENIKKEPREVGYLLKDIKKDSTVKRYGTASYRGWLLDQTAIKLDLEVEK